MSKAPFVLAALLLVATLGISSTELAPAKPSITAQQFVKSYVKALNHADVASMMKMFSKSEGVTSIGDGTISHGWRSIKTDAQQVVGREGTFKFTTGVVEVTPLGSAHVLAVVPLTVQTVGQDEDVELPAAMTFVLAREGRSWKVIHEHWSSKSEDDSAIQGNPGEDAPEFGNPEGPVADHDPRLDLTAAPRAGARCAHGMTCRGGRTSASTSAL